MNPILQEIRKRCRMAMNGDASAGMRKYGLAYKLNFGLMISQIKEISTRYEPNAELAEILWKEDTRELKILAGMLYPLHEFSEEKANVWVVEIPNQEIREQLTIHLFQELPFAVDLIRNWALSDNLSVRATAYWLLARMYLARKLHGELFLSNLSHVWSDALSSQNVPLRNSAVLALKHTGRNQKECIPEILKKIKMFETENVNLKNEVYEDLSFEFEFFSNKTPD